MNAGERESDIQGYYTPVKIHFAPICTCKNNRWIWHHNTSILPSHDVTCQLWWRNHGKSDTTAKWATDYLWGGRVVWCGEAGVREHKIACKKYNNACGIVNNDFSWLAWRLGKNLSCDFVALGNNCLIRGKKIVIHGNPYILIYQPQSLQGLLLHGLLKQWYLENYHQNRYMNIFFPVNDIASYEFQWLWMPCIVFTKDLDMIANFIFDSISQCLAMTYNRVINRQTPTLKVRLQPINSIYHLRISRYCHCSLWHIL